MTCQKIGREIRFEREEAVAAESGKDYFVGLNM
jgi:hypothetical protein